MRKLLAAGASALALMLTTAEAATPTPVLRLNDTSQTGTTATFTASGSCPAGALVAGIVMGGGSVTTTTVFGDSTGATWIPVFNTDNNGRTALATYKRLVGANPIVSGSTTFNTTSSSARDATLIDVECISDGTAVPTTADSTQPGAYGTSQSSPFSTSIPANSTGTGYQIAFTSDYALAPSSSSFPASGSTGAWTQLWNTQDAVGTQHNGLAVAWNNSGAASTLNSDPGGATWNLVAWAEVDAGGGGGATPQSEDLSLLGAQ